MSEDTIKLPAAAQREWRANDAHYFAFLSGLWGLILHNDYLVIGYIVLQLFYCFYLNQIWQGIILRVAGFILFLSIGAALQLNTSISRLGNSILLSMMWETFSFWLAYSGNNHRLAKLLVKYDQWTV